MLKKRLLTAFITIPLVFLAVWFDTPLPWFTVFLSIWGILAVYEFYRMTGISKNLPLTILGTAWTLLFILQPHFVYRESITLLLTAGIMISLIMLVFSRKKENIFIHWMWMIAGALYVGWLLSLLISLKLEAGRSWVYLVLFVTIASDTAAYFIGKAIGKHKLAPSISPGKTWEGTIAGICGAILISFCFTLSTPLQLPLGFSQALILGFLISVFGQLGDLAESLLKRTTGVKDSSNLMPGHGGILDRMDSMVFAGAVVYLYYLFIM
jgi:phosphatidate cytidylyltransferase